MPWVSSHRRGGLLSRNSWVRRHYRRSPRRASNRAPVVPLVVAAIFVIVLIAVF